MLNSVLRLGGKPANVESMSFLISRGKKDFMEFLILKFIGVWINHSVIIVEYKVMINVIYF